MICDCVETSSETVAQCDKRDVYNFFSRQAECRQDEWKSQSGESNIRNAILQLAADREGRGNTPDYALINTSAALRCSDAACHAPPFATPPPTPRPSKPAWSTSTGLTIMNATISSTLASSLARRAATPSSSFRALRASSSLSTGASMVRNQLETSRTCSGCAA